MELVILYIALAGAGAFGVSKGVDLWKHSDTIEADKYAACIAATESARQCRGLE